MNVLAAHPDRFYLVMIAQGLAALGQVFTMSVPPNLAAVWFGPDQVSSACAIGVFGSQVLFIFLEVNYFCFTRLITNCFTARLGSHSVSLSLPWS